MPPIPHANPEQEKSDHEFDESNQLIISPSDTKEHQISWYMPALLSGFSGLSNGYNIMIMSIIVDPLEDAGDISSGPESGLILASVQAGLLIGLILGALLGDNIGRNKSVLVGEILVVICSLLQLVDDMNFLIAVRFLLGGGLGLCLLLKPLYVAELANRKNRGKYLVLFSLMFSVGLNVTNVIDYYLTDQVIVSHWRTLLALGSAPAFLLLILISFAPPSPIFTQMEKSRESSNCACLSHFCNLFKHPQGKYMLAVGTLLSVAWVFQAEPVIMTYRTSIFESLTPSYQEEFSLAICLAHLLGTICAIFSIDYFGRRPILFSGFGVSILAGLLVGLYAKLEQNDDQALVGVLVVLYMFACQAGPTSCLYAISSEIFSSSLRAAGMCVLFCLQSILIAGLEVVFKPGQETIGTAGWMILFCTISGLCLGPLICFLPETNGIELGKPTVD